jgi:hypothetical protein
VWAKDLIIMNKGEWWFMTLEIKVEIMAEFH